MEHTIELFSRSYSASAETLWHALKLALPAVAHATMTGLDDERMQATFTTPLSLTSWGQNLTALVSPIEGGGSLVRVYGVPTLDFLSTHWGEELHARQVEREFVSALEKALISGKTPIENIELFQLSYQLAPEALWNALKSALQQMSNAAVTDLDERNWRAAFSTNWSLTSWGQNLHASIEPRQEGDSLLRVYGVPRSYFFSTRWGEELHAAKVEHELARAIQRALQ